MDTYIITYTPYKNGCQMAIGTDFEFMACEVIDAVSHAYMVCLDEMKKELMTCSTHLMHEGESVLIEVHSQSDPDIYDCDELFYHDVWMAM